MERFKSELQRLGDDTEEDNQRFFLRLDMKTEDEKSCK